MIRDALVKKGVGGEVGFRWRSHEILRIEGLSDAVFGFAVALLIVSLEVPKSYEELAKVVRGFPAFAICFALLLQIWFKQYLFFRRYGLQDIGTVILNLALLFVVLFYVYPLKFLFTLLVDQVMGHPVPQFEDHQTQMLFFIYGVGYVAVFGIMALLYARAGHLGALLELTPIESFDTRNSLQSSLLLASVGVLSIVLAAIGGWALRFAGPVYFLLGPLMTVHGTMMGKRRRPLEERLQKGSRGAKA